MLVVVVQPVKVWDFFWVPEAEISRRTQILMCVVTRGATNASRPACSSSGIASRLATGVWTFSFWLPCRCTCWHSADHLPSSAAGCRIVVTTWSCGSATILTCREILTGSGLILIIRELLGARVLTLLLIIENSRRSRAGRCS